MSIGVDGKLDWDDLEDAPCNMGSLYIYKLRTSAAKLLPAYLLAYSITNP